MAASDDPFVLVLDDYHVITAEPVHALLRVLIEQGPPFAHLVVVTREDPPLPLPRLRAHGRLVEIRAHELRYTGDEAAAYLGSVSGVRVDEGQVGQLVGRTEGWIAGLQLAAHLAPRPAVRAADRLLRRQPAPRPRLPRLRGGRPARPGHALAARPHVGGRALHGRPVRPPDRPDGLGAAARRGRADEPVPDPARRHVLLVPLPPPVRRLPADAPRPGRGARAARAGRRLPRGRRFPHEAIAQAIEAGSIGRAVRLLEAHGRATYESGELSTLLRWLDALPDGAVGTSGELCALRAWSAFNVGRVADAVRVCAAAEAAHAGERPPAPILAVRAIIAAFTNQPDAIELAEAALADTAVDPFYRTLARQALANGHLAAGQLEAAAASARQVLPEAAGPGRSVLVVPAVTTIASSLLFLGRRDEAETLCRETHEAHRAEAKALAGGTPYLLYWLGMLRYEAGDVEEALAEMERGWAAMGTFGYGRALLTTAVAWLALARLASGAQPGALDAVRTVRGDASSAGLTGVDDLLAEIEARVQVLGGDVGSAARWADLIEARRAARPVSPRRRVPGGWAGLAPSITLARVRLAQGRCRDASRSPAACPADAGATGDVADLVTIGVLERPRLPFPSGDRAGAQRRLEDTVRIAAPARYVRRIVDEVRARRAPPAGPSAGSRRRLSTRSRGRSRRVHAVGSARAPQCRVPVAGRAGPTPRGADRARAGGPSPHGAGLQRRRHRGRARGVARDRQVARRPHPLEARGEEPDPGAAAGPGARAGLAREADRRRPTGLPAPNNHPRGRSFLRALRGLSRARIRA